MKRGWLLVFLLVQVMLNLGAVNRGLKNPTLTHCFMNSAIQVLSHIQPLTNYLLSVSLLPEQKDAVAGQYIELIRTLKLPGSETVDPTEFRKKWAVGDWKDMAVGQKDTFRFFTMLSEALNDTFPGVKQYFSLDGLCCVNRTICSNCGNKSFLDKGYWLSLLLLADDKKSPIILNQALDDFFRQKSIICFSCNNKKTKQQQLLQEPLPHNLIFHINRFVFEKGKSISSIKKNMVPTPFPLELTLSAKYFEKVPDQLPTYKLCGLVLHSGSTLSSGHYVAFTRDDTVTNPDQQWAYFNDLSGIPREPKTVEEMKKIAAVGEHGSFQTIFFVYEKVEFNGLTSLIGALSNLKARLIDLRDRLA